MMIHDYLTLLAVTVDDTKHHYTSHSLLFHHFGHIISIQSIFKLLGTGLEKVHLRFHFLTITVSIVVMVEREVFKIEI